MWLSVQLLTVLEFCERTLLGPPAGASLRFHWICICCLKKLTSMLVNKHIAVAVRIKKDTITREPNGNYRIDESNRRNKNMKQCDNWIIVQYFHVENRHKRILGNYYNLLSLFIRKLSYKIKDKVNGKRKWWLFLSIHNLVNYSGWFIKTLYYLIFLNYPYQIVMCTLLTCLSIKTVK